MTFFCGFASYPDRGNGHAMIFVSLTRLRIRSIRFLPSFAIHTSRSLRQVKRAPGLLTGALLLDRKWTFWTMTAWENQENMRNFMIAGSHKAAMIHLLEWCDEASVARARWGEAMTADKMKECVWVRPELVAQIDFLE
jgi:hypothetical protein